jgi:hypothetical protein
VKGEGMLFDAFPSADDVMESQAEISPASSTPAPTVYGKTLSEY